jgi:hypothetical protein
MGGKYKITFVVPERLKLDLHQQIISDSYGLRGKSKWVSESIHSLLRLENFKDLVQCGDELHGFEKVETIVVPIEIKRELDTAVVALRREYPLLEGVQSRIIRTSILQRLIRSPR